MRRTFVVAWLVAVAAMASSAADEQAAEKPDAVVFLDKIGRDAAPAQSALADVVVLSEVPETDPYFAAVAALGVAVNEVVPFKAGKLDDAFRRLAELRPGFVIVLIRPATLDVNFHFEFLERASRLDDDPFVDFAFGYLTGATADECVAFAQGIAAARKRGIPRTILDFGPATDPHPVTPAQPHPSAKGVTTRRLAHHAGDADVADVADALKAVAGVGVFNAWGHGSPDRVTDGLTGAQIRASALDLFPSLYFSGPCWCGTTGRWFDYEKGVVAERQVAPRESFLLALIKARATGIFAGLDPDRGECAEHELEHMLVTGDALGLASKSTYDDVVLAYRRQELALPRHGRKKTSPFRDISDQMIAGGACRAFFGDPTFAPFPSCDDDVFRVATERTKDGLAVTWRGDDTIGRCWSSVDVFRAGGGWTHRIRFRFELLRDEATKFRKFQVVSVTKDGKPLAFTYPTAALEAWGDSVRVHGMLIFPTNEKDPVLAGGKSWEARFLFRE